MEFGVGEDISGDAVPLQDRQGGFDRIKKSHRAGAACLQIDLLGNLRENDMGRHIFLRDLVAAHRDIRQEDAPCAVRRGAGGEIAIDLLNEIGDALDRLPGGDVFLQNFQAGLLVILKAHLAGFAGAERHGLLGVRHHIRLRHGFLPDDIDISGDVWKRCGAICTCGDGGGIAAGHGFDGQHRAGDRRAGLCIGLDDLHAGQFIVCSGDGILLVSIGRIHIDADRGGVCTIPCRRFAFHEGPQSLGDVLYLDHTAIFGHIAADDLPVAINQEAGAIQPAGSTSCDFFQRDVRISRGRRGLIRLRCVIYHQLAGRIVIEEALTALDAGLCIDRPFCGFIFYHRGDDTLGGVICNLLLELRILLGLFFQHPIDVAKIGFIGIGVRVAAAIDVAVSLALEGLMIPHIGLCGHKQAAGNISLIVHNECHHPLEVFKLLGVQLTHAALRQRCFQDGVRVCTGGGSVGVAVQETGSAPAVAIAAIQAVKHFTCCHRGLVAVRCPVMEKSRCPVVGIAGRLDTGSGTGSGKRGSRKQRQQRHNDEKRRHDPCFPCFQGYFLLIFRFRNEEADRFLGLLRVEMM